MQNTSFLESSLIASKLIRPSNISKRVARPSLIQHLNDGLDSGRVLTLVSAPAGYGKSVLIAEWTAQIELPVTWLLLDELDDDPVRFFQYFIAALQKVDPSIGTELAVVFRSGQIPPQEILMTFLTNDILEANKPFICVLDDFQVIQEKYILNVLHDLLNHPLPQFHLVIVTREDPALPLAKIRSRNLLTEIRASNMRFSKDEIDDFFKNVMQLILTEKDISILEERTEGWVAGMQLAGLSMQGRVDISKYIESLSGSHRHILGYLTEEVLNLQTASVQSFLLQTSILSRLTGELCDAVTGQAGSAALLENFLISNLFIIPLDDEQRWYRYHPLFSDLLRSQMQRTAPGKTKELHERASRWYADQHMPMDAIEHALLAFDYARTMDLLETHTWNLLNNGYVRRIEIWMKSIPSEWLAHSPRTSLGFAWMHMLRGNFAQVIPYLNQATDALASMPETRETTAMQAEYYALQSNLMQVQGKIPESIQAAQQALHLVDPQNARVVGLAYLGLGAGYRQAVDFDRALEAFSQSIRSSRESGDLVTGMLATTHFVLMCLQHGRLHLAAESAAQSIEWMENSETTPPPIVGAVYGALGLVYYEWNQVEKAREYFLRGIQLSTFSGHNASLIYTRISLARLFQSEGDFNSASKTLTEALELLQAGAPDWLRPGWIAQQVNLYLAENKIVEAEVVLRQSGILVDDEVTHTTDEIHLAHLRLLLHRKGENDLKQGIALAIRILSLAESGKRNNTVLQVLTLGARLYAAAGDGKTSLAWLERAIKMAEPESYIRLFIDEGAPFAALLHLLPNSTSAQKILALFPASTQENKASPQDGRLVEALTARELEVLHLLAEGLKYAEIAEQLIVSVNTVRYHVKGIYGKLGADRQAKAIETARRLRLL